MPQNFFLLFSEGFLLTSIVGLATYFQFKSSFALAAKKGDGSAISPVSLLDC